MGNSYYSKEELKNLKNYKGGITIDNSLIYRYILSPLCTKIVKIIPSWIAYVFSFFYKKIINIFFIKT